ncbi:MAG: PQQ-binding-like beta-propeller repeat protein [Enterobacterales bacterium]
MFIVRFLLVIFLVFLISGCVSFNIINKNNKSLDIFNTYKVSVLWSYNIKYDNNIIYSYLHPMIYNNFLFIPYYNGVIKRLNIQNGYEVSSINVFKKKQFFSQKKTKLSGGLYIYNDILYIGSKNNKIYAINIKNGKPLWVSSTDGNILSTPIINNKLLLIHTSHGKLQAFDSKCGKLKWTVNLNVSMFSIRKQSSPVIYFRKILVGDNSGLLHLISYTGDIIWSKRISKPLKNDLTFKIYDIQSTPVVLNNIVYAIAYNGYLVSLNIENGNIIWLKNIGSLHDLFIYKNCLYLMDRHNTILAINIYTGNIIWKNVKLSIGNITSPILYKHTIIIGDSYGYLYILNIKNGKLLAKYKIDNNRLLYIILLNKNELIIQSSKKVFCLSIKLH